MSYALHSQRNFSNNSDDLGGWRNNQLNGVASKNFNERKRDSSYIETRNIEPEKWKQKKSKLDDVCGNDDIISRYYSRRRDAGLLGDNTSLKELITDSQNDEKLIQGLDAFKRKKNQNNTNANGGDDDSRDQGCSPNLETVIKLNNFIKELLPTTWLDLKKNIENQYEDSIEEALRSISCHSISQYDTKKKGKNLYSLLSESLLGDDIPHSTLELNNCGLYNPKFKLQSSFLISGPKFPVKDRTRQHLIHIITYSEIDNNDTIFIFYGHYKIQPERSILSYIDNIAIKN